MVEKSKAIRLEEAAAAFLDIVSAEMARQNVDTAGELRDFSPDGLCMNLGDEYGLPWIEVRQHVLGTMPD